VDLLDSGPSSDSWEVAEDWRLYPYVCNDNTAPLTGLCIITANDRRYELTANNNLEESSSLWAFARE
jgi:hypothetical protein